MKNMIQMTIMVVGLALVTGCSRKHDPNQVAVAKNDAGQVAYVLVAPIKGKPFADGAQFLMDNLVKSQTGGDIQSIKVDPASVQVVRSDLYGQTQKFDLIGAARIALVDGKGQFDIHFRDEFFGPVGPGRIMLTCSPSSDESDTAYIQGASAWIKQYQFYAASTSCGSANTTTEKLNDQLSLSKLVADITAQGAVNMQSLDEWRKANAYAWTAWYSIYSAPPKVVQAP
jgi:hypothetical protein